MFQDSLFLPWKRICMHIISEISSIRSGKKLSLLSLKYIHLTHLPLVPHICVSESGQHWFRWWLVAYSAPSQYLNQCWIVVNCTIRNKFQWNFNQNTKLFIPENAFENIVCEKAAILSRGDELKRLWKSFPIFPFWHKGQFVASASLDWNLLFVTRRWCERGLNLAMIYFASSSNCTN